MTAALFLFASDGTLAASDDDGAGGTNALLTYTATELDVFYLDATNFSGTATGAYDLSVTRSGADVAASGSPALDGTVRPRVQRGARRLPAMEKPAGR